MTWLLSYNGPSSPLHFSHLLLCPHPIIVQKYFSYEIKLGYTILSITIWSSGFITHPHLLLTSLFATNLSLLFSFLSQFSLEIITLLQPLLVIYVLNSIASCISMNLLNWINPVICLFHPVSKAYGGLGPTFRHFVKLRSYYHPRDLHLHQYKKAFIVEL